MAAHDLRNPAAAISHAANRLEALNLEDNKAKRALEMIHKSCDSMQVLLNDLLDISAIETGKLVLSKDTVNLCPLIQERVQHHQVHAQSKNISIAVELPDSAMVDIDSTRMSQVLDNLLSNAIKYSPANSQTKIQLTKESKHLTLSVIDQGPGIKKEDADNLFTAFKRLGHKTTGGESSHGLGLAICIRIMQAHAGTIAYRDAEGGGSHFYIEIPK